mgnify:CR=1 FL=1
MVTLSLLHVYGDGVRIDTVFTKDVKEETDLTPLVQALFAKAIPPKHRDDDFTRFGVRPSLSVSVTEDGLTHMIRQEHCAADMRKMQDHRASAQCAMPF